MPDKPLQVCHKCQGIKGRCGCVKEDAHRPSSAKRGYGRQWRKFRINYIRENAPIRCNDCKTLLDGTIRKIELHHIVKVRDDLSALYRDDNIMVLCSPCHKIRTSRGE